MTGYETQSEKEAQFWIAYERIKAKPPMVIEGWKYKVYQRPDGRPIEVKPLKLREIA